MTQAEANVAADLMKMAEESDAGLGRIVFRKDDGTPVKAVIVVRGDATLAILMALEVIEKSWDEAEAQD